MIDQPAADLPAGGPPTAGQIVLPNLNFPWGELAAQGVPAEFLVASNTVQLALAMLTGQHNGVPHLLDVDDAGHLGFNILEIAGQALTLGKQSKATSLPVTLALDDAPANGYAGTAFVAPAAGVVASVQIGGFTQTNIHLALLVVRFENISAAGVQTADFTITDGATVIFQHHMMAGGGAGGSDLLELVGCNFKQVLASAPMILAFGSCPAGCAQSINAGYYLPSPAY